MAKARQTIRAVYKEGVLRPLEPLDLPEECTVDVTIDSEGIIERFENLVKRIHERNKDIPPEEIEQDIELAIKEVREERKTRFCETDRS